MPDEKPLGELIVGDRFWLACAQELIKAAVAARDRRAEQLTGTIGWFWTIYSAIVLVVWTTRTLNAPLPVSVLLTLPTILLMIAYWAASQVRAPIPVVFDPRVPSEIEAVYEEAVRRKSRRLFVAEATTGLAAACVVLAVLATVGAATTNKTELHGYIGRKPTDKLLLLGSFPSQALVRIRVETSGISAEPAKELEQLYRASTRGELRAELAVPEADAYRVSAFWSEGESEKGITTQVKRDH